MPPPISKEKIVRKYSDLSPSVGGVITDANLGVIKMETHFYDFLTCYRSSSKDFFSYFYPFTASVWLALAATTSFTVLVVNLFYKTGPLFDSEARSFNCSLFLTFLSILLNTFGYTPPEIHAKRKLNAILAVWWLLSIVISNAYRGDNFAKTTVPSKGVKVEKFEELEDFTIYSGNACLGYGTDVIHCYVFSNELFEWLVNRLHIRRMKDAVSLLNEGTNQIIEISITSGVRFLKEELNMLKLMAKIIRLNLEENYNHSGIEPYLDKCDKTAFIAKNTDTLKLFKNFNESCSKNHMYLGKDAWFVQTTEWHIQLNGGGYMKKRFRYLEYSGIYNFWRKYLKHNDNSFRNSCPRKKIERLSLNSDIVLLLYFYIGFNGISFIALFVEGLVGLNQSN